METAERFIIPKRRKLVIKHVIDSDKLVLELLKSADDSINKKNIQIIHKLGEKYEYCGIKLLVKNKQNSMIFQFKEFKNPGHNLFFRSLNNEINNNFADVFID